MRIMRMGQRDYWTGTPDVTDGHDVVRVCGGMDDVTGCCPHIYCVGDASRM
jgi:hypothetical protein